MRELGVRHDVPFKGVESRPDLALPEDLQPIAARILEQALAGTDVSLDPDEERLLRERYIHQSAHWIPNGIFMTMKPTADGKRKVYRNHPQEGYPQ
jgi:type VI secretion system secreted protein VgrG